MLYQFQDSAKMTDVLSEFECWQSVPAEHFETFHANRISVTDLYGHLNNTRYFEWLANEPELRYPHHGFLKAA